MTSPQKSPIWHPFTQHGVELDLPSVASASGAWIVTRDGNRLFDAISSWWVITHGHCHPRIVAAIQNQAAILDQVIFAGTTHEPAESVADQLLKFTPAGLDHVFFSDSGSTSVEVALKMALGYWRNIGKPRTRILALEHAYHGDTIGTMSAGARGVFNAAYAPLLFDVGRIPFPYAGREQATFSALDAACGSGNIAALICEPLVLGAGGMLFYSAETLAEMRRICRHHGVLFIADEVMTGFGRTGKMFACEHAQISPDILCLAKGLTGGSIPLAVTLCSGAIFDAHRSTDRARMFFHSSSYTANPIACAAASANLAIWSDEPVLERLADLGRYQSGALTEVAKNTHVTAARQIGTIAAFDITTGRTNGRDGYLSEIALPLRDACRKRGALIRPLGSTVYIMPPYCSTQSEIVNVYTAIVDAIGEVMT